MDNKIDWATLGRYLLGESSKRETKEIESWIADDPERQQLVDELKEIWNKSARDLQRWNVEAAWSNVSKQLSDKNHKRTLRLVESPADKRSRYSKPHSTGRRRRSRKRVLMYAAVAAIVLIAALLYISYPSKQTEPTLVMQELVAERGQRSQFQLSDGSKVWLNAESKLQIPNHFTSEVREVTLQGEAFFKITPDPDKPFIVHAGKSVTKVLGTRFNVQAYDEQSVRVVVEEGRVAFGSAQQNLEGAPELIHNQMGVWDGSGRPVISPIQNMDQYTSWRRGELVFRDTPLSSVVPALERWYDIHCVVADSSLLSRTVNASFRDESMTDVLQIISLSIGMEFKRDKRAITFYGKEE